MSSLRRSTVPDVEQLYQAILSLRTPEECQAFLGDLLTVQELTAFSQRLQIAKLLSAGSTYDMVRSQIPVSSSTITRVNTELRYGAGGYRMVLERLNEDTPDASQT